MNRRIIILFVSCAAAIFVVRRFEYMHPSRDGLGLEITKRRAVVAVAAEIRRNEPPMRLSFTPNAVLLTNPVLIDAMPAIGRQYTIVVADDHSFAIDVRTAIYSRKELHNDWDAILGSNIRIVEIAADGSMKVMDSGRVNFIEVRFQ